MEGLIQRLRDACVGAVAICRLIKIAEPDDLEELRENAKYLEEQCLDLVREIDATEDN